MIPSNPFESLRIPSNPYAPPSAPSPAEDLAPLAELYLRGLFRNEASLGKGRLLIFSAGIIVSAGVFLISGIIAFI